MHEILNHSVEQFFALLYVRPTNKQTGGPNDAYESFMFI